jgi:hypothetical protein
MAGIELKPDTLLVGAPITAFAPGEGALSIRARTPGSPVDAFSIPLVDGHGQFQIGLPGPYEITGAGFKLDFTVLPRQDLSFGEEFGFFSLVATILVGGMILWLRKRARSF